MNLLESITRQEAVHDTKQVIICGKYGEYNSLINIICYLFFFKFTCTVSSFKNDCSSSVFQVSWSSTMLLVLEYKKKKSPY